MRIIYKSDPSGYSENLRLVVEFTGTDLIGTGFYRLDYNLYEWRKDLSRRVQKLFSNFPKAAKIVENQDIAIREAYAAFDAVIEAAKAVRTEIERREEFTTLVSSSPPRKESE